VSARDRSASVGPIISLPALLRDLGADPPEVLAAAGIAPKLFDDPEHLISFAARGRLLSLCVARTRCPHFGLRVGQRASASSLGLLGFLIQQSLTVGTALGEVVQHLQIHDRGAAPMLAVQGGVAMLGYVI
jgi:hypothetical protein